MIIEIVSFKATYNSFAKVASEYDKALHVIQTWNYNSINAYNGSGIYVREKEIERRYSPRRLYYTSHKNTV